MGENRVYPAVRIGVQAFDLGAFGDIGVVALVSPVDGESAQQGFLVAEKPVKLDPFVDEAGDKYETSREMIAQEQLKLSKQLSIHQKHLQIIRGIDDTEIYNYVKIGSVVTTNMGVFFIAVSLGFITLADNKIALISSSSPIGNLMMGKKSGDKFNFNQTQYEILTVA